MSGFFVTFEGGEGSGKSTQIVRLAARLRAGGHDVLEAREPGGTPLAERIRALLLGSDETAVEQTTDPLWTSIGGPGPGAWAEAFLMEAARADLVARVIVPALEAGQVVLCDRYADSTLAYQGGGRGLDAGLLEALNQAATAGLTPDLTLLFDLDPAIGLRRRTQAPAATNRLDRESHDFHVRVRARYLALARAKPDRFVVLDATRSTAELERDVWSAFEERVRAPKSRR